MTLEELHTSDIAPEKLAAIKLRLLGLIEDRFNYIHRSALAALAKDEYDARYIAYKETQDDNSLVSWAVYTALLPKSSLWRSEPAESIINLGAATPEQVDAIIETELAK